ncbi:MAG TPA: LysE family transporter [Bacteroidales bacterium]|nr:LysE family transporter [Bacteroidales bacterium]
MFESIFTISLAGFIAGFIFAMPIAGPISILIVSNALNGRKLYSNRISIGAALSDFIYVFVAVYGVTSLYSYYSHFIPFIMIAGAIFFVILGIKIFNRPVDIEQFDDEAQIPQKIKDSEMRGVYTGFMVNMLNATQFVSGLVSSFFVISLIAALGFNTGGLESRINNNVKEIGSINGDNLEEKVPERIRQMQDEAAVKSRNIEYPSYFNILISVFYALALSSGSLVWFFFLAWILTRYRKMINIKILSSLIKLFGISLCLLGLYFGYLGAVQLL